MFFKTTDNKQLYYEFQLVNNSWHTLVFLNGLTQSTLSWGLITPIFKEKYNILLLDFIFQGQSDKTGDMRDFDTHANDIKHLFDSLHLEKPVLIGISYGSLVAQHYAVNYPSALLKLVLISTFSQKSEFYKAIELSWQRALEAGGYDLLLDIMLPYVLSDGYFQKPIMPIDIMKATRKDTNTNVDALKKLMMATQQRADYLNELPSIKVPTLIIQGEKDLLFPPYMAKQVADKINNAKLVIIKNAGHTLNLEKTGEVSNTINDFLS